MAGQEMTAFDWLWELDLACCGLFSTERPLQLASNSEMRRWFNKGAVLINGQSCGSFDKIAVVTEIVLFPKSDRRRTSFRF